MHNWFDFNENLANTTLGFSNYKELPNSRALVIVNLELNIIYCNESFSKLFLLYPNDSLYRLNPNSELLYLLKGFAERNYLNLSSDINLIIPGKPDNHQYQVNVERIILNSLQYLIITIESLQLRKVIERKINALHSALDHGKVPILITDAQKRIVYATRSFEEIFSKGIDNLYQITLIELLLEYLNDNEREEYLLAIENKIPWKKLITIAKRGNTDYWEFTLNSFTIDEELEDCLILSASNLTEHIYQKKMIEASERRQKLIIDNISDLLLILKYSAPNILFENANDNFCNLFQLDKQNLHLKSIDHLLISDLNQQLHCVIEDMVNSKNSFTEFSYNYSHEQQYSCKVTCTGDIITENKIFIISMKDITEEKRYREQLEKSYLKELQLNKMKSDFLANISHEIRTPFNGIIGYSEILDECIAANDFETIKDMIGSMKEVLGRALNLFTNLVEVSQIEAGEVEIEKVELNCNQVLKKIYDKRINDAQVKNLEFTIDLAEDDSIVEVDWVKLERIIDVLIDNAIKYTIKGFVNLRSKSVNDKVVITICDSGIGIEKSQISRLLTPFTQEVEGYTRPYEGVGLGLTVAYKLTKLLDGEFEINSEKNKGTEINISFYKGGSSNNIGAEDL